MKQIIIMSSCLLLSCMAFSQVVVNVQLPPAGLTVKSQLWNLSLINTSYENMTVQVEVVLTDVANNQMVLTGTTGFFSLPRGVKLVQAADVMPVAYNVGSAGYNIDTSPDGFLPVGVFNICYTVIKSVSDYTERLSETCETIEIEPLSPPQLVLPADSEYVDIDRPLFTWLPPSPYNLFSNLQYDWVLTEVMPTQTAADAIGQNIPVLTQQNIGFTNFQYPLSAPALDTAKLYAWRVTAKNNFSPIAESEIWTFRLRPSWIDSGGLVNQSGYYARLKRFEDAAYTVCTGLLRYEYYNESNSDRAVINIYDVTGSSRKAVGLDSGYCTIKYGQNLLQTDLRDRSGMIDRHVYVLELISKLNEKWYLKFEYRKPE